MPVANLILAYDIGTTGNKATLYSPEGRVVAHAFQGYPTYHPQANWAEQDADDWWRAVCQATQQLLVSAKVRRENIACVSFSGQMQGCLPVDAAGRPLHRCLIWADQRAVQEAAQLESRLGMAHVYHLTGHRLSPTYSGPKIMWLRNHKPDVYAQTHRFLHVKDYVIHRLCGCFVTDCSDASGMNLYDLHRQEWAADILAAAEIEPERLPAIHQATDVVGVVTRQAEEEIGLRAGTPVVVGGGDGACATVGAGAVRAGIAYNYLGSSSWIAYTAPAPVLDAMMRTFTFAHLMPGMFIPCGTMQTAGGAYQWLRDQVCVSEVGAAAQAGADVYEVMNEKAAEAPPGAHHLLFLPYLLGERSPYWHPQARGAFVGLTVRHTRADLIRAVLEGISFYLKLILQAFLEAGADIREMRVIGGGAKGMFWRQMLADVYGLPISRPRLLAEATSLGAAVAGGVGVGLLADFTDVDRFIEIVQRHQPEPRAQMAYEHLFPVFRRAYDALRPVFDYLYDKDNLSE